MKLTIRIESEEGDGQWPTWKFESIVDDLDSAELGPVSANHLTHVIQAALRMTKEDTKILKEQ